MNVGVMVSSLEYIGPHLFLTGIERQAVEYGYSLILTILDDPIPENLEEPVRMLLAHQVSGIIWVVPEYGNNYAWWRKPGQAEFLANFPIVFMNARPVPGTSVVSPDDRHGAYLVTRHLLEQGYRQIGIITGPSDGWEANQRLAGWRDALLEKGISPQENQVAVGNWKAECGEPCLKKLLKDYPEMDALFVSSDQMALGVLSAAFRLGIHIPEDLAIAGFDDFPETAYYTPPLTTVRRKHIETGKLAMRELHRKIQAYKAGKPLEHGSVYMQPELIIRNSTPPKTPAEKH
jgi:DNA-binding LacI/PurR family transcriptional regulator